VGGTSPHNKKMRMGREGVTDQKEEGVPPVPTIG
jgi:hypothetical protein